MRSFLDIELNYLQANTHALSIQAVVERALTRGIRTINDCRNGSLKDCLRANDLGFIQQVLSAGRKIMNTATELSLKGSLRYAPLRITTFITCASVLFLKAMYLCRAAQLHTQGFDWDDHLQDLITAITALRSSPIDDMDFSSRYATLIEKQVAKLRICLGLESSVRHHESLHGDLTGLESNDLQSHETLDYSLLGHETFSGGAVESQRDGLEQSEMPSADDSWWTSPFDPSLAPFTSNNSQFTLGFDVDSLDFLLNLTNMSGLG